VISPASFPTDLPAITQLFRAYAQSLPIDLGYQGFDGELASLPGKYAPPQGALLIARDASGAALGCVARSRTQNASHRQRCFRTSRDRRNLAQRQARPCRR